MKMEFLVFLTLFVSLVTVSQTTDIDLKHLKCLVCRTAVKELKAELDKINPKLSIEVGNYRLNADGSNVRRKIPLAESEMHISEMLDSICNKMDDYVRGIDKTTGKLTIFNLISPTGQMNPKMSEVDVIQDGDLNKSLKYFCQIIVEEHEDEIISTMKNKLPNPRSTVCTEKAKLCKPEDEDDEDEDEDENGKGENQDTEDTSERDEL